MAYTINRTDGSILCIIPTGGSNTTATTLALFGQNALDYGQQIDENFVYILENSASTTPPVKPMTGQLWFNTANSILQVWNGSSWSITTPTAVTVSGNAQANITSVGTLTGLALSGPLLGTTINAGIIGNSGSELTGTLTTNAQPAITSVGSLTSLSVVGDVHAGNIFGNVVSVVQNSITSTYANVANSVSAANISGTIPFATTSTYANIANLIAGANVVGIVAQAAQANTANVATTANSIAGANVTGIVAQAAQANTANIATTATTATTASSVTSNAQANITSVGTLTGLSVGGNVTAVGVLTNNYRFANGSPATFSANSITFTAPFASATATNVYNKIKSVINVVADYGADPTGSADSSTAFQNALNAAGSGSSGAGGYGGGPAVYIPPGTYKVNSQLTIGNNTTIFGDSQWNTVINTNVAGTLFYGQGRTDTTIRGLTLQQTGSRGTSRGINTGGGFFWNLEDLNVYGFHQGFFTFQSVYHMYTRCNFEQCDFGMYFDGNNGVWGSDYYNNVHTFTNCRMLSNGTGVFGYLSGASFTNCDVSSCTTVGMNIIGNAGYPAYGIVINNLYAEAIGNVMSFNNARVSIAGYLFSGNSTGGKIILAQGGTQVQVGVDGFCYGGFGYGAYVTGQPTGGSRVILNTNFPNATTNYADSYSSVKYFAYSGTPG